MALDVTPYVTVDEAFDYFDTRIDADEWISASDENRLRVLKQATRLIDRLKFRGFKTDPFQYNEFPRDISGDVVPDQIKIACCELAFNLLTGTDLDQETDNLFTMSNTYASVSTGNNQSIVPTHIRAGIPSIVAWLYLKPYLCDPRKIRVSRVN